jgi:uncharacterized protein (DUF2062 family)
LRVLRRLLHVDDTPHRTAAAFGIGLFIAFFPILGVHTVLALGIAFLFRLNRVALLVGAFVNNPWTLGPMYLAGTLLGCVLLGVPVRDLSAVSFSEAGLASALWERLSQFLWPFVLGNLLLGAVAAPAGYWLLRPILERRRAERLRRSPVARGVPGGGP